MVRVELMRRVIEDAWRAAATEKLANCRAATGGNDADLFGGLESGSFTGTRCRWDLD